MTVGSFDHEARCGVCGASLDDREAVACVRCETAHHRDCWDFQKVCSVYACGSRAYRPFRPKSPGDRPPAGEPARDLVHLELVPTPGVRVWRSLVYSATSLMAQFGAFFTLLTLWIIVVGHPPQNGTLIDIVMKCLLGLWMLSIPIVPFVTVARIREIVEIDPSRRIARTGIGAGPSILARPWTERFTWLVLGDDVRIRFQDLGSGSFRARLEGSIHPAGAIDAAPRTLPLSGPFTPGDPGAVTAMKSVQEIARTLDVPIEVPDHEALTHALRQAGDLLALEAARQPRPALPGK